MRGNESTMLPDHNIRDFYITTGCLCTCGRNADLRWVMAQRMTGS